MNSLELFVMELLENFFKNSAQQEIVIVLGKLKAAGVLDKLKAALVEVETLIDQVPPPTE